MRAVASVTLLAGCLDYAQGMAQVGELNCRRAESCGDLQAFGYGTVTACIEDAQGQPYDDQDCPDFDAGQMRRCLAASRDAADTPDCDATPDDACHVCG